MTKEMTIRVEFKYKGENVKFDAPFQVKPLGYRSIDELIVDFSIRPKNTKIYFTDEEMNTLLSEFDEKLKSYEIIEIKEIKI